MAWQRKQWSLYAARHAITTHWSILRNGDPVRADVTGHEAATGQGGHGRDEASDAQRPSSSASRSGRDHGGSSGTTGTAARRWDRGRAGGDSNARSSKAPTQDAQGLSSTGTQRPCKAETKDAKDLHPSWAARQLAKAAQEKRLLGLILSLARALARSLSLLPWRSLHSSCAAHI